MPAYDDFLEFFARPHPYFWTFYKKTLAVERIFDRETLLFPQVVSNKSPVLLERKGDFAKTMLRLQINEKLS